MNKRCYAVLLNKLTSKEKDPVSFTIPYDIGQLHINNALADLEASISLMPYTMYEKLRLGEPKATRMRSPAEDDECYGNDVLDDTINAEAQELLANDRSDSFSLKGLEKSIDQSDLESCESLENKSNNESDLETPIRHINSVYAPYSVEQRKILPDSDRAQRSRKDNIHLCKTSIFHDMVEDFMEVFMDDLSMFGNSFDCCHANLDMMLARCEETNLVLNWEKCHIMVKEGIILGHKISGVGIEVDRAKIDVITKFSYPTNVKGVRSFLGHAGFYRRFIKDFSMISKPMTKLLIKDAKFDFSDDYKKAFIILKERLTTMPIIISPDWNVPFELMCATSDFVVGAVLGQLIDGKFKPTYYADKTLNNAQEHYTTTKKELLAVVFSFDKFRPYLVLSKTIVYTDHSALKYLFNHLSRLENPDLGTFTEDEIEDEFLDEHLMILKVELNDNEPWYADYVNYIIGKIVPPKWTPEK
ncbi:reverse transcriptase domain-containing protein [Tanacetum coccineum]